MLCLLPEMEAVAGSSLSSGFLARTSSFELRPPLPRMDEAAALARVAFHLTCGKPDRIGKQDGSFSLRHKVSNIKSAKSKPMDILK